MEQDGHDLTDPATRGGRFSEQGPRCGLFGFIGDAPRLSPLIAVLNDAARRSPTWGIALEARGKIRIVRVPSIGHNRDRAWDLMKGSTGFIGHACLTAGVHASRVMHPLVEGRIAVSHVGTRIVWEASPIEPQVERLTTDDSYALLRCVSSSHGDLGVRVLAAMQQLPPVPHALLVMEPNAIVAARQSERAVPVDANDGSVKAKRQGKHDALPLFFAQSEEGTYFCTRRVLDDMCEVEGVMTFRRFG